MDIIIGDQGVGSGFNKEKSLYWFVFFLCPRVLAFALPGCKENVIWGRVFG